MIPIVPEYIEFAVNTEVACSIFGGGKAGNGTHAGLEVTNGIPNEWRRPVSAVRLADGAGYAVAGERGATPGLGTSVAAERIDFDASEWIDGLFRLTVGVAWHVTRPTPKTGPVDLTVTGPVRSSTVGG